MKKIVVFDCGWGGELIGDYLEEQIPVEVEKVIKYKDGQFGEMKDYEIAKIAETALAPYVGHCELIVLADTSTTVAIMDHLKYKFPNQKFVGYGEGMPMVVREFKGNRVMILTTESVKYQMKYLLMKIMTEKEIVQPECIGWSGLIDDGELKDDEIRRVISSEKAEAVLIYATSFIDIEDEIRASVAPGTAVIDMRQKLLRDVCTALEFVGKDGRRPRGWWRNSAD